MFGLFTLPSEKREIEEKIHKIYNQGLAAGLEQGRKQQELKCRFDDARAYSAGYADGLEVAKMECHKKNKCECTYTLIGVDWTKGTK